MNQADTFTYKANCDELELNLIPSSDLTRFCQLMLTRFHGPLTFDPLTLLNASGTLIILNKKSWSSVGLKGTESWQPISASWAGVVRKKTLSRPSHQDLDNLQDLNKLRLFVKTGLNSQLVHNKRLLWQSGAPNVRWTSKDELMCWLDT